MNTSLRLRLALLLVFLPLVPAYPVYCSTYFVATDGNDLNDGSIDHPFRTIAKGVSVAVAGDTIYVRGGTYTYTGSSTAITLPVKSGSSETNRCSLIGYNGERPRLDFTVMTGTSVDGLRITGSYWYVKGIDFKGAPRNGMRISGGYNIVEFCYSYENRNTGVRLGNGAAYNQIINCDSFYNYDYLSDPPGSNADGFAPTGDVGTGNYFYGCRSWQNSDNGYDGYLELSDDVTTTYENCWSYKNGYLKDGNPSQGNGNGFKMGGSYDGTLKHNVIYKNCLSWDNKRNGFDQSNDKGSITLYNCTAYANDNLELARNYSITEEPASGKTATVANCIHYIGMINVYYFVVQLTNSWNGLAVSPSDFLSTDPTINYGPRWADGSLPVSSFMHLAPESHLIDSGTDVGLPYNGFAPDLGAYESQPYSIYVDANATGANNGLSWANAYKYLRDALTAAGPGAEIRVAQGNYRPDEDNYYPSGSDDRTATFQLKNKVAIYGGYPHGGGSRDPNTYTTILSGDINVPYDNNDNSYHVVTSSSTDSTILDGFTITKGNANGSYAYNNSGGGMYNIGGSPTVTNCTFIGNSAVDGGGGMRNGASSPTVTNCKFTGNTATNRGGGMYNGASRSTVTNCTFTGNSANYGGGMYNDDSSPTVTNCTFTGNSGGSGGGVCSYLSNLMVTNCTFIGNSASSSGGGIYCDQSSPTVTNCTFSGNSANTYGGGMINIIDSNPTLTNCTFKDNLAEAGGGMCNYLSSPTVTNCTFSKNSAYGIVNNHGGGMYNNQGNPTMTNCTFTGNSALNCGGGIFNMGSNPPVTNCTFSGNSASYGGGMYNYDSSNPTVINCILWGNTAITGLQIYNSSSTPTVSFSDVQGGYSGTGNIDADPLFFDANNLRLSPDSPCIDAADNNAVPEGIETDLDGHPRKIDGDCNGMATVDMGAYEFTSAYFGDFDSDCDIDFIDFAIQANFWLTDELLADIAPTPAGDGIVDTSDLAVLCDNWLQSF